jgi:hypothetical protein
VDRSEPTRRLPLEGRVLEILDAVIAGQHIEDSRVELKSRWPPPEKAARDIAAGGNAARGSRILWILGVDEKGKRVAGLRTGELASWWAQVASYFDDAWTPVVEDLVVNYEGVSVLALFMDTTGAPYVVKTGSDKVSREMPWRDTTRVRSAQRRDLVRLFAPLVTLPDFEVLEGRAYVQPVKRDDPKSDLAWRLSLKMYVTPQTPDSLVFPFHRGRVRLRPPGKRRRDLLLEIDRLGPTRTPPMVGQLSSSVMSRTIDSSDTECLVFGPGMAIMSAGGESPPMRLRDPAPIRVVVELLPATSNLAAVISTSLDPFDASTGETARWGGQGDWW